MRMGIELVTIPDTEKEVQDYVWRRILYRPETNIRRAVVYILIYIGIMVFISAISIFLITNMVQRLSKWIIPICVLSYFFLSLVICAKKALIGLVHLYQHYAPENVRRRCIFKPTCSEYMILAIEKYGVVRGLCKGLYRLFVRCNGFYYSIDYP